jgi:hypothetical protein
MAQDDRTKTRGVLGYETPEPKPRRSWRWLLMVLLAMSIPWAIMLAVKVVMKIWFVPH